MKNGYRNSCMIRFLFWRFQPFLSVFRYSGSGCPDQAQCIGITLSGFPIKRIYHPDISECSTLNISVYICYSVFHPRLCMYSVQLRIIQENPDCIISKYRLFRFHYRLYRLFPSRMPFCPIPAAIGCVT